jgi:hypothetical protein
MDITNGRVFTREHDDSLGTSIDDSGALKDMSARVEKSKVGTYGEHHIGHILLHGF